MLHLRDLSWFRNWLETVWPHGGYCSSHVSFSLSSRKTADPKMARVLPVADPAAEGDAGGEAGGATDGDAPAPGDAADPTGAVPTCNMKPCVICQRNGDMLEHVRTWS